MFRRIVVAVVLLCSLAVAQSKRPITFEDMMALKRVGEPVVSPDGKWVVFSAVEVNLDENTRKPRLWIIPLGGGEAQRLLPTTGPGEDRPRFSPDGKRMIFLSSRDGGTQVWMAEFNSETGVLTGEPRKITSISTEADGAIWSPDGKNVLFTSQIWTACTDDECNKKRDDERGKSRVKAIVYDSLFYRHWSTYATGKKTHLFIVPAEGGVARDLTPGKHDVPPFSLGGQDLYAISPDGQEVAYTSNITERQAISTNNDIFIIPIAGGTPKQISNAPGSDSTPLYSPDGKYIAWRMQVRDGYESDRFRLVVFERATGKITNLTEGFDRWVGSYTWKPDSSGFFFSAEDKGEAPIYELAVTGGTPREVIRKHNDDLTITPDGKTLLFTRMSAESPNEIHRLAVGAKESEQLTHLNDAVLGQVHTSPAEPFWFKGAKGVQVQGFIVKPPAFDEKNKYPVKFLIHGGPQGAWGDSWTYRWNAQLFASDGYVVVMINPRGSTGYGQKFIDDINGDWGGRAYTDLINGFNYIGRTYGYMDTTRTCAMGASFGGYMVNWMLGHTNVFKCFVSHDGMFNTESAYGTTEELWFPEWEFTGTPWNKREVYRKWSPHNYAKNFKTPTLVVHGQLDYRLDVGEGFQLFTTLQRLGVPSKFLYFPDEGHWVLKPQNSRLWYRTVNSWVDQWLKK